MKRLIVGMAAGALLTAPGMAIAAGSAQADATASYSASAADTQAARMARNYLSISAFSRSGLIEQLKYEGFSTGQATRAVDSLRISWKKQAAKSAKSYLKISPFSRSGLIEQLVYEGFTTGQATYGVRKAGL